MRPSPPGKRHRKKLETHEALKRAALELFITRGYERTTVNAIAGEIGKSRRTFFRYFASKEDVVLAYREDAGNALANVLAARPSAEPPLSALRNALLEVPPFADIEKQTAVTLLRLIDSTPALRARFLGKQEVWTRQVAEALAARAQQALESPMLAHLTAAVALATFEVALHTWSATHATVELNELVYQAFAALGPGLDRTAATDRQRFTTLQPAQIPAEHSKTYHAK